MFEKSSNTIRNELLDEMSDTYQKTIGYPAYDFSAAIALPLSNLYSKLQEVYELGDVENMEGDVLATWVFQRTGLVRKAAVYATGSLTITGSGTITEGDLFESEGGVQFVSAETAEIDASGTIAICAVVAGSSGNVGAGSITVIPVTITGIASVTNAEPTSGGFDAESDAELRQRYYEKLQMPITSGNIYHYKMWAKSVSGVGEAKIFPLDSGDNTVGIVIVDADKQPASPEVVAEVQAYIDPESSGEGNGQAPIGAYCTVESAVGLDIDISCDVVLVEGYELAEVQDNIKAKIIEYLKSIAFLQDYVSYAKIGNAIINAEGVGDYSSLLVNSGSVNVAVAAKEVAVLGLLEVSESSD